MKKFKLNILPIIGMMVAVATFAFTTIEKNAAPQDGWYEVTLAPGTTSDIPANQVIGNRMTTPPLLKDDEGCAQEDNDGLTCAIHLTFEKEALEVPATVEDAEIDASTEVGDDAKEPEE